VKTPARDKQIKKECQVIGPILNKKHKEISPAAALKTL